MAWAGIGLKRIHMARWMVLVALLGASALLAGCDEDEAASHEGRERVVVKSSTLWLEPALDPATRELGLGGRDHIDPDGGMLFVFPQSMPLYFVMRDCLVDIDIAFLDGSGRVTAIHEMKIEPPRQGGESAQAYEDRLKRYRSKFAAQFAIEVAPGTFRRIGLGEGDLVELDTVGLKRQAR